MNLLPREHAAIAAMQAILGTDSMARLIASGVINYDTIADKAVEVADALIKRLNQ